MDDPHLEQAMHNPIQHVPLGLPANSDGSDEVFLALKTLGRVTNDYSTCSYIFTVIPHARYLINSSVPISRQ